MSIQSTLPNILLWLSRIGAVLLALISGYLMIMALIALLGALPPTMNATYEVPVELKNLDRFYKVTDLNSKYEFSHFEVKKANIEVLPQNRRWPQFTAFFTAGLYVSLFLAILILLSTIVKAFVDKKPFKWSNVRLVRWIGYLTIAIGIFEYTIEALVSMVFYKHFVIENATLPSLPSFWEINFAALFLGFVIIVLSETFRTGAHLQQLEELTV